MSYLHLDFRRKIGLIFVSTLFLLVWQLCLVNGATAQCIDCHKLFSKTQFEEWEKSGHAKSLETLKASQDAENSCLQCHSSDIIFDENATLDTAQLSNECGSCHADHKGMDKAFSEFEPDLLKAKGEVCNDCHSASDAKPGETPPSAQLEIYIGAGGVGVDDAPGIHYTLMQGEGCVKCHTFKEEGVADAGGHTFKANLAGCLPCHNDPEAKNAAAQKQISDKLDELEPLIEAFEDKESEDFKNAKFNFDLVRISGGYGAHNLSYANKLLDYSLAVLQGGEQPKAEEGCLLCHNSLSADQVDGWKQSNHAISLDTLQASPDAQDACLQCHSVDYQLDPENVTLETAQLSNGCGSCHADHKGLDKVFSEFEHDLLKPKNEVCNDCHSAGEAQPGETPESAQLEIFTGTGGIGVDDSPGIHSAIMPDGCVACHTSSIEKDGENVAHTFVANPAVCDACHGDQGVITNAKAEIETRLGELAKLLEEFPDKESQEYKEAQFNVDLVTISGDFGAHNFKYSQSLLAYSESVLQKTEPPAWDVNQDGVVDISDLVIVGQRFGEEIKDSPTPNPDVNRDGTVDVSDLALVGIHFGEGAKLAAAPAVSTGPTAEIWLELEAQSPDSRVNAVEDKWLRVNVKGDFVAGLFGYQFNLDFDPNVLSLVDQKRGAAFGRDSRNVYWHPGNMKAGTAMSTATLLDVASCLINPKVKAPSAGALAQITFAVSPQKAKVDILSTLQLKNVKLVNEQGQLMQYTLRQPVFTRSVLDGVVNAMPTASSLYQNYPNPFNPETWIPYQLAKEADVKIKIYNSSGKLIRVIDQGHRPAGFYLAKEAAYWDGRTSVGEKAASGVYFYQMDAGEFTRTRKMLLVK